MKLTDIEKESILAFAECDMNFASAARKIYVNRNTLIYRLEKVQRDTGLNQKRFYDLVKLVQIASEQNEWEQL